MIMITFEFSVDLFQEFFHVLELPWSNCMQMVDTVSSIISNEI